MGQAWNDFWCGFDHSEKMSLIYFGYAFILYVSMIVWPHSAVAQRVGDMLIGALLIKIQGPKPGG